MNYIVELEPGVWIAKVQGDPGRTLQRKNAQQFILSRSAKRALNKARTYRPFKNAKIQAIDPSQRKKGDA